MKLYRRTKSFDDGMMSASYITHEATPADLLAAVRRGVESGTIKGEVVEARIAKGVGLVVDWKAPGPGRFIVVGPV